MNKYLIIPILIPQLEYEYNCIFARKTDYGKVGNGLTKENVITIIDNHLEHITKQDTFVEVELYISTIKDKSIEEKDEILKAINEYKLQNKIDKISVKALPIDIDKEIIKLLKKYKIKEICVKCLTSNEYLLKNLKLGYEFKDVKKIVRKLRWNLFMVSSNIMIGLPESTVQDDLDTVNDLCKMKIKKVDINLAVVEKGSNFQKILHSEEYEPKSNVQIIEEIKEIIKIFDRKKISINEIGNHNIDEKNIEYGYNKDLRKMIESAIWYENIVTKIKGFNVKVKEVEIEINPEDEKNVIGYKKENIVKFQNVYDVDLKITKNEKMNKGNFKIKILQTYADFIDEN